MVTEPQKKALPDFYKELVSKIQAEILNIQHQQAPSEEEIKLNQKIDADPSDLQSRFDLAKLQFEKGKMDDAIESCL